MRSAYRVLTIALLISMLTGTTGCTTWHVETAPLPTVVERGPSVLRVRVADSTFLLRQPMLRHDTLSGTVGPRERRGVARVATADVHSVATRHTSALRSALLGAGVVLGTLAVVYVIVCDNPTCE